jgi:CheY-like chemotaxis protein
MRGSIGVESTVGRGTTFWVEFPRTSSPLEGLAYDQNAAVHQHKQTADAEKRTVLYIEDNPSNLTLIEQILAEEPDIELMTAMQGKVGLEFARQHSPDLILLDLHLPDLPGWEVLAELQKDEATRHIPTIVISADATARQIKRLLAAGARSYLTKPVNVAEFCRVLDETTKVKNETQKCTAA